MPTPVHECDRCGACCEKLIIEIEHLDVVREPRLLPAAKLLDGNGRIHFEDDWDKEYSLACGHVRPCPMLDGQKLCTIYPTRPNVCVAFEAGSEQCQDARRMAGLDPLPVPVSE